MAIPETQELMLPILQLLADQKDYRIRDLVAKLAEHLNLTDEDLHELTPGGSQAKFYSRVTGARSYLTHANLLGAPRRGISRITESGLQLIESPPENLDLPFLATIPEFIDYLMTSRTAAKDPQLRKLLQNLRDEQSIDEKTESPDQEENDDYITEKQLLNVISGFGALNTQGTSTDTSNLEQQLPKRRTRHKINPDAFKKQPVSITLMALFRIMENYFQHRWLYLLPIFIAAISCGVYFALEKPSYLSEGIISVKSGTLIENVAGIDDGGFSWVTPAGATAGEFNELLQTDAFVRLIIQQTPLEAYMDEGNVTVAETIQEARDAISVYTLGSNQIKVEAEYRIPTISYKLAESAVNSFVQWQIDADKQDTITARVFLENLIPEYESDYNNAIESLEGYLLQNPEPLRGNRPALEELQINRLQTEVSQAYDRYITAQDNLEQIRLQEVIAEGTTRQTYTIVDYPQPPLDPEIYFTDIVTIVVVFAAVGITLTVLGIIGNTALDTAVRLPIDARYITDLPVLGVVPAPKHERRRLFSRKKKNEEITAAPQEQIQEDEPQLATTP